MLHRKGSKIKLTVPYLNSCFAEHVLCCFSPFFFCLNLFSLLFIHFFPVLRYVIPSCSLLPSFPMLWVFVFFFPYLLFCCLAKGSWGCVPVCSLFPLAHTIPLLFYILTTAPSSCLILSSAYYFLFTPFAYGLKYL